MTIQNEPQLSPELEKIGIINEDGSITFAYNELAQALEDQKNGYIAELEIIYILIAYDHEKERLGEIVAVRELSQAQALEKILIEIYGGRNVTFASRKIDAIPTNLLESLTKGTDEK
jgi:hypothetical protein